MVELRLFFDDVISADAFDGIVPVRLASFHDVCEEKEGVGAYKGLVIGFNGLTSLDLLYIPLCHLNICFVSIGSE